MLTRTDRAEPYSLFAPVYNYHMRYVNYVYWSRYLLKLMQKNGIEKGNLLEIAAGTGTLASYLKPHFKSYMISDISKDMLKQSKSGLQKICFDMRKFPLKTRFDIVLSAFDSINYILSPGEIKKVFDNVSAVLPGGGKFLFDTSLERNSHVYSTIFKKPIRIKDFVVKQESRYDSEEKIHTNTFTFEFESGKIIREIHRQRIYTVAEIEEILTASGFTEIKKFDSFSFREGNEESFRIQFIAGK
ncbi:MAG: class I SAM-dependent methyltransferase [Ignavibacteriaceae bacterium]|nr:class I SAM-dependent methyltransferase [Ignavibacteriaceae bacterium]